MLLVQWRVLGVGFVVIQWCVVGLFCFISGKVEPLEVVGGSFLGPS